MAQESKITEKMRKSIGAILGQQTIEVDEKWIIRFAEVMQDANPLWTDKEKARKGKYREIITPPSFNRWIPYTGKAKRGFPSAA